MKKLLVTTALCAVSAASATAADLPRRSYVKAPPAPVPVVEAATNWSGFYLGANFGWGWSKTSGSLVSATPPLATPIGASASGTGNGIIGGGQVGVNWQTGPWVLGVEGEFDGARLRNHARLFATLPPYPPGTFSDMNTRINWLATVTGRGGYAWNNSLLYIKGGAAFMNAKYSGGAIVPGVGVFPVNSHSTTRTGWTVGAGYEQAIFGSNWSWKLEYDYLHFGKERDSFFSPTARGTTVLDLKTDIHVVKAGLNYRL